MLVDTPFDRGRRDGRPPTSVRWSRLGTGAQGDRAAGRDRRRDWRCRRARRGPLPVASDLRERGFDRIQDIYWFATWMSWSSSPSSEQSWSSRSGSGGCHPTTTPKDHRSTVTPASRSPGRPSRDPRDRARNRQRGRDVREREGPRQRPSGEGDRSAVRLEVQYPEHGEFQSGQLVLPVKAGAVHDGSRRRAPLVLGPELRPEDGCGPGHRDVDPRDTDTNR